MQTISSQNEEPVGIIVIKNNIVQRRHASRVLWDRIFSDSPVYSGDLVRVADLSAANLNIEDASIELHENTLIRILRSPDGEGPFRIELNGGNLSIDTGEGGGSFTIALMGSEVQTMGPGTVLNAGVGEDGVVLQVKEGTATFTGEGESRELASGMMLAFDAGGAERIEPAAVIIQPRPNARYLKNGAEPLPVSFAWNRINLGSGDVLRFEIAADRNFSRIVHTASTAANAAQAALDAGLWYWRLSYGGNALSSDRFTITDGSRIELISPVMHSVFFYSKELPELRFQWSEVEDALYYLLEVCETPDFANPRINRQMASAFSADASLWPGTWYWRVRPVFSSAYGPGAVYSPVATFRIERSVENESALAVVVQLPEPEPARVVAPEPPPPPPRRPPPPPPRPVPQQQPPPPFAAPLNRLPAAGYRIGIEQLRAQRNITFSWAAVQGANAYIFTLYQQTPNGRRQITRIGPEDRTSWTMTDLNILDRGTFIWQVEAVNRDSGGSILRRGAPGENTFVLDIPLPEQVRVEEPGILYGY